MSNAYTLSPYCKKYVNSPCGAGRGVEVVDPVASRQVETSPGFSASLVLLCCSACAPHPERSSRIEKQAFFKCIE
jgi:hypothetical protein